MQDSASVDTASASGWASVGSESLPEFGLITMQVHTQSGFSRSHEAFFTPPDLLFTRPTARRSQWLCLGPVAIGT